MHAPLPPELNHMNEIDTEAGAAEYLAVPAGTLRQWRHLRSGPRSTESVDT